MTEEQIVGIRKEHEGIVVNHQRVARLYRAEGLAVRRQRRKRVARDRRGRPSHPTRPNQHWALDFLGDALACGRRMRLLAVLDVCTREELAIAVDTSLPGARVVRGKERLTAGRVVPRELVLDNGPELAGRARDQWASEQGSRLRFIEPGQPVQNAVIESFNGRLRDECRNQHWFVNLVDARRIVEAWRQDDHHPGPQSGLGYRTPAEVRREFDCGRCDQSAIRRQELVGLSE